jgi:hypothetical protein
VRMVVVLQVWMTRVYQGYVCHDCVGVKLFQCILKWTGRANECMVTTCKSLQGRYSCMANLGRAG